MTITKTTIVVPADRSGNDASTTKTRELWESPRTGVRTVELDQFSRAKPDAAPAGYSVKDIKQTLKELQEKLDQIQN